MPSIIKPLNLTKMYIEAGIITTLSFGTYIFCYDIYEKNRKYISKLKKR